MPSPRRRPRFLLTVALTRMWNERLTRPGRYLLIGAVSSGIAGSFPQQMVGSVAFSFFASLLLMSVTLSTLRRPRATATRTVAPRCMAGQDAPISIRVTNPTPKVLYDVGGYEFRLPSLLKIEDEARYIDRLEPGASHAFDYRITARRRGSFALAGPSVVSIFPFGLTRSKRFFPQMQHVVVYPTFTPLLSMELAIGRSYQPGGVALASRVGESMEYIGNREYRPGDRMRDLHPRSWARRGFPVVRQREEEFLTRVAILVDTYAPWYRSRAALEANLSLAAAVADWVARREFVVDLFAAGPQLYHFSAGRSLAHLEDILDILACIERCGDDPLEVVGPQFAKMLPQTTVVVALMMNWDKKRQAWVDQVRSTGVKVKLVVVTDDRRQAEMAVAAGAVHLRVKQVAKTRGI
jgi:uncharacterized protein (DUF58 family)